MSGTGEARSLGGGNYIDCFQLCLASLAPLSLVMFRLNDFKTLKMNASFPNHSHQTGYASCLLPFTVWNWGCVIRNSESSSALLVLSWSSRHFPPPPALQ